MKSKELRKKFINFFKSKDHTLVSSSPIVISDDPTLLFVNAGMNQFKDIFLGNSNTSNTRVVNTQKCLRVSGKHNDLEEVGYDTYHHTMFEMLGNWSFGDYFKKEAIDFGWEFLTKELKIPEERLYVSFFKGDANDKLAEDSETYNIWNQIIPSTKIIPGSKKDNFWEMGQIGPCGPCTEIHVDLRSDRERSKVPATSLINKDHPQVIEIWNIVFIEFNRKKDNSLEPLPKKHVDTGMGFERLCMVLQNTQSTYDTDIFKDLIAKVANISGVEYGHQEKTDIAIRVIVDHIRAIVFAIADGQLPSNNGAGYVVRRILRRAVRYGYTYLNLNAPFLYQLVDLLGYQFATIFPEIDNQQSIIQNVIKEEEKTFFKTLGKGLDLISKSIKSLKDGVKIMDGSRVFELYDTYGFPPDLTALILKEKGLSYSHKEFDQSMREQKNRSRSASEIILGDWILVNNIPIEGFIGYDQHIVKDVRLVKYRKIQIKGKDRFHLVFDKTPFYPEGGGQIGDSGYIEISLGQALKPSVISILDTKKENNMIIHIVEHMIWKSDKKSPYDKHLVIKIDINKRQLIRRNHSATHLLHYTLRTILGNHVEQRGSYVHYNYLRFDFTHYEKIQDVQLKAIEEAINKSIVDSIMLEEFRKISIKEAKAMGALALFGEKYENYVRVVRFGDSIELCGGTHVNNTSEIGLLKIISESSIASGIRRVEAVTSQAAIKFLNKQSSTLDELKQILKSSDNIISSVNKLIHQNKELNELVSDVKKQNSDHLTHELEKNVIDLNGCKVLIQELDVDVSIMKNICFSIISKYENAFLTLATKTAEKVIVNIAISKPLVKNKQLNAAEVINQVSRHIDGRGGGQSFFAVTSGSNSAGLSTLFSDVKKLIKSL
ncbi:MAG: alanine--tRNA ligase [Flavobacteriales bacterium]|nr:alanine--tRNA ligase [Flavobacteriales bacterium]